MGFIDICISKIKKKNSPIMVGLDPHYDKFPKFLLKKFTSEIDYGRTIFEFNRSIIDAVYDIIPAVKPQIAFYERFGLEGIKAYLSTIQYAKSKGLIVIGDVKRNDIGSTAMAYSDAHLGRFDYEIYNSFNVDAITVNPYLGSDGINPFLKDVNEFDKGIFVLVKTSNKSSFEIQDIKIPYKESYKFVYEHIADLVSTWGKASIGKYGFSSVGAVVGATYPEELISLRKRMPSTFFLIPGVGAQGGDIRDLRKCFTDEKLGALINVSRSVLFAYKSNTKYSEVDFALAAREEVISLNKTFNSLF